MKTGDKFATIEASLGAMDFWEREQASGGAHKHLWGRVERSRPPPAEPHCHNPGYSDEQGAVDNSLRRRGRETLSTHSEERRSGSTSNAINIDPSAFSEIVILAEFTSMSCPRVGLHGSFLVRFI